jgi:glutamine synthetase
MKVELKNIERDALDKLSKKVMVEYLWLDGNKTPQIRSKTKIISVNRKNQIEIPDWIFDGSSTNQAKGEDSDCILKPVAHFYDPLRNRGDEVNPHIIVLNEVYNANNKLHLSNNRSKLRTIEDALKDENYKFGIEQEYTFFQGENPLGWPKSGKDFPKPQGDMYCGQGADNIFGREIVEEHMRACLKAGLMFEGINAEVMPGQWEYQIGAGKPIDVGDHLIIARYLLQRIAEKYDVSVSLESKPRKGDWNGAGAHTNFSNNYMRQKGQTGFEQIISRLEAKHAEHIEVYGENIEQRLTGKHETCSYKNFKSGRSDRGASIRIPGHITHETDREKIYLEDRRPCANIDPYAVMARIMQTVSEYEPKEKAIEEAA